MICIYEGISPRTSSGRGDFTTHAEAGLRAFSRTMKKPKSSTASDILKRIDQRRAALQAAGENASDREISKLATGSEFTLGSIRKGIKNGSQRGISTETLGKLAPVLKTSVEWLTRNSGPEVAEEFRLDEMTAIDEDGPTVPLVGFVSAGAQAINIPLHENELDRVPAPSDTTPKTRALEIRGDSLGELFDRWIVYFDDEQRPVSPDLLNRLCIVALQDGRVLVKKIKRASDGSFDLISNTEKPIRNVQIKWAARVKHMAPR